eukprot:5885123-Prymnesium_polylepis.1
MQAKHQPTDEDAPLARQPTRAAVPGAENPTHQPPRYVYCGSARLDKVAGTRPVRTLFPLSLTRVPHAPPSRT